MRISIIRKYFKFTLCFCDRHQFYDKSEAERLFFSYLEIGNFLVYEIEFSWEKENKEAKWKFNKTLWFFRSGKAKK